jgi:predicted RNA-binding Zn ribbon-like protein
VTVSTSALIGEPLPLDLINTRAYTPAGDIDALSRPDTFHAWLVAQAGRLSPIDVQVTERELDQVRAVRDHIRDIVADVRLGQRPTDEALHVLVEAQLAAPAFRELAWVGGSFEASRRRVGSAVDGLVAELAEATVDFMATNPVGRLRECDGPGCHMVFLPVHPNRRWCSPALCGNRVRVARYYQRHSN